MSTTSEIDPVKVAENLVGRELKSEEIAHFYRLKDELQLSDNDAIWSILLAFGHYKILYEDIPAKIKEASLAVMSEFKVSVSATADAAERSMINRIEKDSAAAVSRLLDQAKSSAQAMNVATYKHRLSLLASLAAAVAFCVAGALVWGGYQAGQHSSAVELAWLNTAQGKAAKTFAELNNVERMLECTDPQDVVLRGDGTFCSPYDKSNKTVRMWRIK